MSRRWRGVGQRRGEFLRVPPAPAAPAAPAAPPAFASRPARRAALARHGRFWAVPWAQGPQNAWTPAVKGPSRRAGWLPPARRGRFYGPSWQPVVYGTSVAVSIGGGGRPGRLGTPSRRGRFYGPLPVVVAAVAAIPPGWRRARQKPVSGHRARFFEPPWPQVAVQPIVWGPPLLRALARLAGRPTRRGRFFEPPWPQAAAAPPSWPPVLVSSRRPRIGPARRGRFQPIPPRPAGVPAFVRIRPRPAPSLRRRRRFHEPPWPAIIPQPSVWRPGFHGRPGVRGRLAAKLRRGHYFEPGWPQGQQVFPPRWVEGATTAGELVEGAATGGGVIEAGTSASGVIEGAESI